MLNAIVDLSHHNPNPDFVALRNGGVAGVIHKATQGSGYVDPTYLSNRVKAAAAGLLWGSYHFGDNSASDSQVNNFLKVVQPKRGEVLALDLEDYGSASMTVEQAETFVSAVNVSTGYWPGLYCDLHHYRQIKEGSPLKKCWLWLARYASAPGLDEWTLWQYTDGTFGPEPLSIPGCSDKYDRSYFNGGRDDLEEFWGMGRGRGKLA